jgi:hypothetical protein
MRDNDSPSATAQERLCEIASIFAAGILRLHARAALTPANPIPQISSDSGPNCLELSPETVLSVHTG